MGFDPCNRPLNILVSIGTPTPKMGVHLGVWGFIPSHSFALSGAWDLTPGLPSWPATLQAITSVVSPKLGLRHHSRFQNSFNGNWWLRTFSSKLAATCLINSSIAGWEDQSSSLSPLIFILIRRLGRALFFEWTKISFSGLFVLVRIGQILTLHYLFIFGKKIPNESKKEWWSSECFWPLFSPRVLPSNALRWGDGQLQGMLVLFWSCVFSFLQKSNLPPKLPRFS